jgi:hypothetical protein
MYHSSWHGGHAYNSNTQETEAGDSEFPATKQDSISKKKKRDTYIGLEVWLQLRKHKALSSNPSLATHPPKKSIKFKNIFISQSY